MAERFITETERRMLQAFDLVLEHEEAIPEHLIHAAQQFYTWREVDIEVLELLMDSANDEMVLTRAASLQRFMAFGSADRGVHFECRRHGSGYALEGAIVPAGNHEVRVQCTGPDVVTTTDSLGCFTVEGLGWGSMRFSIRFEDGQTTRTPWFELES